MRVIRLVMGIFIILQGLTAREWLFVGMGSLLSLMAVLNLGCCGASGCSTGTSKSSGDLSDVSYEEVK